MRELIYLSTAKLAAFQHKRRRLRFRSSGEVEVSLLGIKASLALNPAEGNGELTTAVQRSVEKALRKTALDLSSGAPRPGQWFRFQAQSVWTQQRAGWPWSVLPLDLVLFGLHLPDLSHKPRVLLCGSTKHLLMQPDRPPFPELDRVPPPGDDQVHEEDADVAATAQLSSVPLSSVPVSSYQWLSESLHRIGPDNAPELTPVERMSKEVRTYEYLVDQKERAIMGDNKVPTELGVREVAVTTHQRTDRAILTATRHLHSELLAQAGLGTAPVVRGYARTLAVGAEPGEPLIILATPLVVEYDF